MISHNESPAVARISREFTPADREYLICECDTPKSAVSFPAALRRRWLPRPSIFIDGGRAVHARVRPLSKFSAWHAVFTQGVAVGESLASSIMRAQQRSATRDISSSVV